MNTDTPLTDDQTHDCREYYPQGGYGTARAVKDPRGECVHADFARQLERENAILFQALENLTGTLKAHDAISYDCDRSGKTYCDCLDKAVEMAEKALSERRAK